jgi:hypothetical protein
MRILFAIIFLVLANVGISQADTTITQISIDSTKTVNAELQQYENDAAAFATGKANSGLAYFQGVLAGVILADVDMRKFETLDDQNGSVEDLVKAANSCLMHIAALRESLKFYSNAKWPLTAKFNELTIEWLDCLEQLVSDYYFKLAVPFSKEDSEMTDAEWDLYEEYVVALETYYAIDSKWVDYQYTFAEANGFVIGGLIEEDKLMDTSPTK